jgi:hypothetical protein
MPRIDDNQDGTKTFSINSGELGALRSLADLVPDLDRVLDFLGDSRLRSTLAFVRDLADSGPAGEPAADDAGRTTIAVDAA